MPLSALTESAQAPTWPAERVDRESQEGDVVTIGFLATAPEGQTVSYSATGLPPGLSINPATGVVSGTLLVSQAGTVNTGGSAGVHTNVTITATSSGGGSSSYVFDWRVSRFRKGDVFAGVGGGKYRVFSDQGEFKYELTVDRAEDFIDYTGNNYGWYGGTTTGCGYNWVTRRMYFTAFDDDYDPSVAEVDPVPVGGEIVRTNRISTFRDAGIERGGAATGIPIDSGPESVIFGTDYGPDGALGTSDDVPGTMYIGHALGYYTPSPQNLDPNSFAEINADINDNGIIGTDDWFFFYYVDASGNPILDSNGQRIPYAQGFSMDGLLERWPGERWLDQNGQPIQGLVQYGRDIQKWLPDGNGGWTRGVPDPDTAPLVEGYDTHAGWQGSDWLDIASDQRTIYYTSEWGVVYRYDVGPNPADGIRQRAVPPANPENYPVQNWPYATLLPENPANPSPVVLYALRLLPPGDGTGGLLVAEPTAILRINDRGVIVNRYDADVDGWFALNIAPDGRSFWSASTANGRIYRWEIATGTLVNLAGAGTSGIVSGATQDGNGRYTLDGLCVMGEYTAAQEICGDGIDNDEDGEVDEVCQPIEACSSLSPGDDDGDGLVDSNDPDCPGTTNVCAVSGYTDPSVAGYCSRFNREGDNVSLLPAPGPPAHTNQREVYTVSGLPPGITAGTNGVLSGTPQFTIKRNTDVPDTEVFDVLYQVRRETLTGALIAEYEQSFEWTIQNVNRPPVAQDFTATIRPGQSASFELSHQTGDGGTGPCAAPGPVDPDCEDTVTVTATTTPAAGTLTSAGDIYTWTAPPTFTGTVSYTYTIADGHGGTDTGLVTINVVNQPPVAVLDTATIRPGQQVSIVVTTNDTDADGDTLTAAPTGAGPQQGAATWSGNTVTYTAAFTPSPPFVGNDTFTYQVSDGFGGTATGTVRITIVNTPPVANDDTASTRPATPVTVNVLTNDTDVDAPPTPSAPDTLTVTGFTQPSNGTVTSLGGGQFSYTSTAGFTGVDAFTYTITDGYNVFDTATVTINVNNQPPVAVDDAAGPYVAGTPPVSFNVLTMGTPDSDPDGDAISLTSFTQPGAGTVVHNGNGNFTWTPPGGYSGVTTFTYTIRDTYGATDTATVTITVRNIPPVAVNDSATTSGTVPVTIAVMQNDSDPDNHVISVTGATTPPNGTAVVNANGTITYTANPGFEGTDTFFYTIRDGFGGESTATVTVTVGPPNRFDPCLCASAQASPAVIWPPNHKKTQVVTITNLEDPDGGPLDIKVIGIYQDEPTDYLGDGDTEIDAGGIGTSTAWVRAERTGNPNVPGNGRVYEIVFEATAEDGSSCRGSVFTGVPHDQGQGSTIVDDGIRYDSTVAGGPVVRTALQVQSGLSDTDVAELEFETKFVGRAQYGDDSTQQGSRPWWCFWSPSHPLCAASDPELAIGSTTSSFSDTDHFNWTSGSPALFKMWHLGDQVHFKLITDTQFVYVTKNIDCANGECDDILIRAQTGGEGTIRLSSMNLNGLPIADVIEIASDGSAQSIHLSGLSLDRGFTLTGLVTLTWTGSPTADALRFDVSVGSACPTGDGGGGGGEGTPPLARSDAYSTMEDTPLPVDAASGILLNDLTFAGPLTASLVSTTSNGTLELDADGSFLYTPNENFTGDDTFTYRVSDGERTSEPAVVTITVNPVADPPIAVDDSATTDENTPVTIAVTSNDSDPFGAVLTILSTTQPSNGAAVISGTSVVYTPAPGFTGVDTFTYTVQGTEGTATATVTVTVVDVNEPPVAVNDAYTTAEDTPLTIAAPGVMVNDSDPDAGDTFTASLVTGPSNGTVTQNADGSLVYTPAANFSGTDTYTYRVRDAGGLDSNVATVTITITPVPDPPVAVDDSYVVAEDSVLTINAPGLKVNDSDPDTPVGDLTVTLVTGAQRGSLTLNADGSFVYTPFPDTAGSDSFVYRLSDGNGSSTATATIAITEEPDPPVAVDDTATTSEDTAVTINVLGNDSDPDTPTLTLQSVTQPANGTAVIQSGQVSYTPADGFNGQDTFTYTITDGTSTATANVVVTVTGVNDPPVAVDDAYTTPQNTVLNVQTPGVVGNDSDPDEDQLTARVISQPTAGSVVFQTHGAFSYTPPNGFTGVATFTYVVNDGTADSNVATVTITVTESNEPPVAVNDSYSTDVNVPLTVNAPGILGNDSDPNEGDTITAFLISGTAANTGTVTLNANGSFTYTPAEDYTGTTTFRYRVRDSAQAESNEAIVTIEVRSTTTTGRVCYDGGSSKPHLRAQIDWVVLESGDVRARATVSRNYVDNTYGVNRIGWGNKSHTFRHLYTSDFAKLAFYDANGSKKIEFKIDYLSPLSGTPSGYGSLGIADGRNADGGMSFGNAGHILSMATSIDLNMNAFGYVSTSSNHPLKSYSPSTNGSYTPNATYPLWIWDVWYEATISASAFGSRGFGTVALRDLHASPAKEEVNAWRLINCQ